MLVKIDLEKYRIVGVGTTGSARRLIGSMLNANTVKNEITAHAVGTISKYPNVKTILENQLKLDQDKLDFVSFNTLKDSLDMDIYKFENNYKEGYLYKYYLP